MATATLEYSADELSAHKTRDDLWLAIHGKGESVIAGIWAPVLIVLCSLQCYRLRA